MKGRNFVFCQCFTLASLLVLCTFILMLKLFRLAAAVQVEEQMQQKRDVCVCGCLRSSLGQCPKKPNEDHRNNWKTNL